MLIKSQVLKGWGPGGWAFFQPETNWHAPGPLQNNFSQQVQNIIKMREANPRFNLTTDPEQVGLELENYTIARWAATYSKNGLQKFLENGEDVSVKKKPSGTLFTVGRTLAAPVAALVGADTEVLEEWLGAGGKAVSVDQASGRAVVCESCPGNVKQGWLDMLTAPAAKALQAYLSVKNNLSLHTPLDSALGVCEACRCHLGLKVFVPLPYIKDNTKPETFAKLKETNEKCWVLTES